jgi:hypothetical protein
MFKFLPKFQDDSEPAGAMMGASIGADLDATVPARLRGPLTRSSLKPKLLFPTDEQLAVREKKPQVVTDEEAVTDIEERSSDVSTPTKGMNDIVFTPTAPKFAPVSPPTTVRATRSSKKHNEVPSPDSSPGMTMGGDGAGDERPAKNRRGESLSPFAAWQRTKARYGSELQGKKRPGDELKKGTAEGSKRHRRGSRGNGRAEAA